MRAAIACLVSLAMCLAFLPIESIAPAHASESSDFVPIVEDPDATAANLVLIVSFSDSPEDGSEFYNQAYTAGGNKYYKTNLDRLEDALNGEPNKHDTTPVALPSGMKANVSQDISVRLNTKSITRAIDEELKITDLSFYFDAPDAFASCDEYVSWVSSNEDVIKVTQEDGGNGWSIEYVAPGEATLSVAFAPPSFDAVSDSCKITLTRIDDRDKVNQSYREYFETISKGDYNIMSYFPQMKVDGTYVPIRVSMGIEEYADHYAKFVAQGGESASDPDNAVENPDHFIITEAAKQLNGMRDDIDASIFDKRNDGSSAIDNVLVIVDVPKGMDFPSHEVECNDLSNVTIGAGGAASRGINRMNFIAGGASQDSPAQDRFSPSDAAAKRLESLGAKALGRDSGTPVGNWDIMADSQSFTWPLATTRFDATNDNTGQEWVDIVDIPLKTTPDNQTFTVYAPAAFDKRDESKPQAYRIKIDRLNRDEYFVVEYRKKEQPPQYDSAISASGLIVYRVNPAYSGDGNAKGNDYVYVFRPGETGLTDSKGDIARAPIAAGAFTQQNGIKLNSSIGATNMTADIKSGAICYSDGSNSGIRIVAKEQNGDSLTFCVEQATELRNNTWDEAFDKNLNINPFNQYSGNTGTSTSITKDGNGNLYLVDEDASTTSSECYIRKLTGQTTWQRVGGSIGLNNVDIEWFDNKLFAIGFVNNKTIIKCYNESSRKWDSYCDIAKGSINDYPQLRVINNELYAMYSHNKSEFGIWKYSGFATFTSCGNPVTSNNMSCVRLFELGAKPALAIASSSGTNMHVLDVASNTTQSKWSSAQNLGANAANIIDATTLGSKTYLYMYTNSASNKAQLLAFDSSGKRLSTQNIGFANGASRIGNLASNDSSLYLTINTSSNGFEVFDLGDGENISQARRVGNTVPFAYSSYNTSSIATENRIYVAIAGPSVNQVSMQYHGIGEEAVAPPNPEAETVTIGFDANGGSGAPSQVSGKVGAPVSYTWPTATPTRSGYDFEGWYTEKDNGKGTKVTAFPTNFPEASTTYYAHWKAKEQTNPNDPNKPTDPNNPNKPGNDPNNGGNNQGSSTEKEDSQVMYRMYNPNSGEHFYTAKAGERDALVKAGWKYEGTAWTAPVKSNTPVYRLYSGTDHHYTTNAGEKDALVKAGWSYEGIGWYSDDQKRVGLHRLYNPNVNPSAPTNNSGSHHYTTSKGEADALVKIGWQYEGIGWHGM